MTDKVRVYVAGPYSSPDPVINTRNAVMAGNELHARGFSPFIPHLTMFWHLIVPHAYQDWLDHDNEWVKVCHAVLRLPGASSGADLEEALAKELGIPVFHSIEDLEAASLAAK